MSVLSHLVRLDMQDRGLQSTEIKIGKADNGQVLQIKVFDGDEIEYETLSKAVIFFVSKIPKRIYHGELSVQSDMLEYQLKTEYFNSGPVFAGVRMYSGHSYSTRFFTFYVTDGKDVPDDDADKHDYFSMLIEARNLLTNIIVTADDNVESILREVNALIGIESGTIPEGFVTNDYLEGRFTEISNEISGITANMNLVRFTDYETSIIPASQLPTNQGLSDWFTVAEVVGGCCGVDLRMCATFTDTNKQSDVWLSGVVEGTQFNGTLNHNTFENNPPIHSIRFAIVGERHVIQIRFSVNAETAGKGICLDISSQSQSISGNTIILLPKTVRENNAIPGNTFTNLQNGLTVSRINTLEPLAWIEPVLVNGYLPISGDQRFRITKDITGTVFMHGFISSPAVPVVTGSVVNFISTLPVGYRPGVGIQIGVRAFRHAPGNVNRLLSLTFGGSGAMWVVNPTDTYDWASGQSILIPPTVFKAGN
jgi:hypothetical protein